MIGDALENSKYISSTKNRIIEEGVKKSRMVQSGDFLLTNSMSFGKPYIMNTSGCIHDGWLVLSPSGYDVDPDFFYYLLGSDFMYTEFTRRAAGATVKNLNINLVKGVNVTLPPLEEQKRIAGILDAADILRAKRREALAKLDDLLQSTFLDLFGDPVTNPKGFPANHLSEFYINKREGTKCGPFGSLLKKNEFVESGIPVWNMDNIDPSGGSALPFRMWITENKYQQLKSYSVFDGDVIISRAGTVGKMCVANSGCSKSIISSNLIRVRFGQNLLPIFFVALMTYCKGRVGRLKKGPDGAFTHMSTKILDKLNFPIPPLDLQQRFAEIVSSVEEQKAKMRKHLEQLDDLFASLQQRAFRGDL